MAIRGFSDRVTETFFLSGRPGKKCGWLSIRGVVKRKLDMLHYAARLEDLKAPPGNRLKPLRGKMVGLHSIRINDQWRVVFRWADGGPVEIQVADYHG